jgi:hypothetical protein
MIIRLIRSLRERKLRLVKPCCDVNSDCVARAPHACRCSGNTRCSKVKLTNILVQLLLVSKVCDSGGAQSVFEPKLDRQPGLAQTTCADSCTCGRMPANGTCGSTARPPAIDCELPKLHCNLAGVCAASDCMHIVGLTATNDDTV